MEHRVRFVNDDVMPDGHNWALCHVDGKITVYLRESARQLPAKDAAAVLESAWEGYRNLTRGHLATL